MLNSFEISSEVNEAYSYNFRLDETLVISYNHTDIFNSVKNDDKTIISYGYGFDVRNPKTEVNDTLNELLDDPKNILSNIKYLNGHFILLFNVDGTWKMITDAAGLTPVYFDAAEQKVTAEKTNNLPSLNGVSVLNLQNFTISRLEIAVNKLTDERIERIILDLVTNQYKYFLDKDITLNFRRNKMNKAIISILHPALIDQSLNLRENDDVILKLSN